MKKSVLIIASLVLIVAAGCNRQRFEKKLTGDWSLDKFLYAGTDETVKRRDTTMAFYKLSINEGNSYMESWTALTFSPDTLYTFDSILVDTPNQVYNVIPRDTFPFVDTGYTFFASKGSWELLNSESDLQLWDDSANTIRIFRILRLTNKELQLRNGNEEMYLKQ